MDMVMWLGIDEDIQSYMFILNNHLGDENPRLIDVRGKTSYRVNPSSR